jgi:hypothetical protein
LKTEAKEAVESILDIKENYQASIDEFAATLQVS